MKKFISTLFLLLALFLNDISAQDMPKPKVIAKQLSIPTGKAIQLTITLENNWHITSHDPKDEFAFGAEVEFKNSDIKAANIHWPKPIIKFIESIGVENSYYENEFTILIPLESFPKKLQGEEVIFHYQSCTEQLCLAPDYVSALIW